MAGQRTAQEVFEELKYRLEGMGVPAGRVFSHGPRVENGREIPKDADIFCTADYGGSEGVYLDVYLKWYEKGRPGHSGALSPGRHWARAARIWTGYFSSHPAITKAFHGDRGTYARYLRRDEQPSRRT